MNDEKTVPYTISTMKKAKDNRITNISILRLTVLGNLITKKSIPM